MKRIDPLSVVIITHNEAEMLENALRSVSFANEVIVVDAHSTDGTVEIAKKYHAKVILHTFEDYGKQKQFAVDQAKHRWVFVLDADERVSNLLAQSILETLQNPQHTAYTVNRKNYFLGKEVTAQYWENDASIRLFDKTKHRFSEQKIHERVLAPRNQTGILSGVLYHLSHRSVFELSKKAHTYAMFDAKERIQKQPPKITGKNIISSAIKYFFELYILGGGYKDGTEGLINALILTYQQRILIRSMIWELQQKPSLTEKYAAIEKSLQV